MKKIKPQMIKDAREILEKLEIVKDGKVKNEYRGYIASFGATIHQSGLVPSVAFYENRSKNPQEDKTKIAKAILFMIDGKDSRYNSLLDYIFENGFDLRMQQEIEYQAVALKLALNTYKVLKEGNGDENSR